MTEATTTLPAVGENIQNRCHELPVGSIISNTQTEPLHGAWAYVKLDRVGDPWQCGNYNIDTGEVDVGDPCYHADRGFGPTPWYLWHLPVPEVETSAVAEAVAAERARWEARMAALSERAQEWASRHGMCSAFDEFMEDPQQQQLGLKARERDFYVEYAVEGTVTLHISASSMDRAQDLAREQLSLSDYDYVTLPDRDGAQLYVTDVSLQDSGEE